MVGFQPTEWDVRVFNSTGEYRVCEEVVRCPLLLKMMPAQDWLLPARHRDAGGLWGGRGGLQGDSGG